MKDLIGKTISHYRIIEPLGQGGMGVVYKARDLKLERHVAIKFLPPQFSADDEQKQRFIQEAKTASALDHPNICTIHEIDKTENGQMFIAMACYEGETLKAKVESGPLPFWEVIDIALQIAQGLARAHEEDIVHRDIKPANVMITNRGEVKIVDFGLAKLAGQTKLTKTGTTLGTAAYMSPEQLRGMSVDHHTDIWALGAVTYEMVTGQQPFKGDYEQAVMYSIIHEEAKPMTTLRSEVPPELQRVVQKALNKDANERYENIAELLTELQSIRRMFAGEDPKLSPEQERPLPSIAVLPFVNMSAYPENEYFSDGLAEELINSLTKIKDLRVVARTSAFAFKGKEVDIREIGKKLNVETVLEGSVRKAGNRLRITAQLVKVTDGYHLWSERYDRDMDDVFAIQDEISLTIVDKLKVELLGEEKTTIVKRSTENLEAYNLYLKGRYYWNKRTVQDLRKAIDSFQAAIEKHSTYALAYAGLADSYALLGDVGHNAIPPKEAFLKSKTAVQKSLELDETLAEAHTSLAHLKMHDFDWPDAEREFKRAIELNPNYATTYHWYGFYFALRGRSREAITTMKRGLELDPVSLAINLDLGVLFYYARQYDKAIAQYRKTLELDPGFARAYITLGSAYGKKGMYREAITMIQKAIDLSGDRSKLAALGRAYALSGNTEEAVKIIGELKELSNQRYITPYSFAHIYACLDQKDQAFEWLQKAFDEHVSELIYIKVDPYLDKLRSDPRFIELLVKVELNK